MTDEQGQFRTVQLRPGDYSFMFSFSGFGNIKRDGIRLTRTSTRS